MSTNRGSIERDGSRASGRAPVVGQAGLWASMPVAAALVAAVVLIATGLAGPGASEPPARISVIIMARPGGQMAAASSVVRSGGRITRRLDVINGFAASLPARTVGQVASNPAVVSVTTNQAVHLLMYHGDGGDGEGGDGGSNYDPRKDAYSLYNLENRMGARSLWPSSTGSGVDVALIDSGVAPVPGLSSPGKVLNGPDLTEESQHSSLAYLDTFGHGTHMAGIIAGRDAGASPATIQNDPGAFLGVAPDSRIVSVKVADAHGNTDVSQVIAAVDWVVQHAHDPGVNIRVVNLSFGTDSAQSYLLDPMAFAVEQAWLSGIVVVTSAGNAGAKLGHLTDPAIDPFVIAVGAVDDHGGGSSTPTVPAFSSVGDGTRNPDLLGPGAHVQSLRDPGSYIDKTYRSTGIINSRFFRGSGTSQASAMIAGVAALLVQQHPGWTPDQIKGLLVAHSSLVPNYGPRAQGAGAVDLRGANLARPGLPQSFPRSAGSGTLEGSRGTSHLVHDDVALKGEIDMFGRPVNTVALATAEAAGSSWSGGTWNGSSWSGSSWSGSSWSGSSWSGSSWSGSSWSQAMWSVDGWS